MSEFSALDADFVCIQEIDNFEFWEAKFAPLGYNGTSQVFHFLKKSGVYKQRTGTKKDGCAIFYKHEKY